MSALLALIALLIILMTIRPSNQFPFFPVFCHKSATFPTYPIQIIHDAFPAVVLDFYPVIFC